LVIDVIVKINKRKNLKITSSLIITIMQFQRLSKILEQV